VEDLGILLFILLFFVVPLLETLFGKRRGAGQPPQPRPGHRQPRGRPDQGDAGPGPAEARSGQASEMLPDDLWELLTGERRSRGTPVPPKGGEDAEEPAWASGTPVAVEPEPEPWVPPSYDDDPIPEPVSLEYQGPEAYSLEKPLPSPEVRHARFHERLEAEPSPAPRVRSGIARRLGRSGALRDAVILSEVLGPPRGLE
jgi:hypothetical protein